MCVERGRVSQRFAEDTITPRTREISGTLRRKSTTPSPILAARQSRSSSPLCAMSNQKRLILPPVPTCVSSRRPPPRGKASAHDRTSRGICTGYPASNRALPRRSCCTLPCGHIPLCPGAAALCRICPGVGGKRPQLVARRSRVGVCCFFASDAPFLPYLTNAPQPKQSIPHRTDHQANLRSRPQPHHRLLDWHRKLGPDKMHHDGLELN